MALPNVSSFPVNLPNLSSKKEKQAKLEDLKDAKPEDSKVTVVNEEDDLRTKSLRIIQDPRFQEIKHHTSVQKEGGGHHLARLMKNRRCSAVPEGGLPQISGAQSMSFKEIVELEEQSPEKEEERKLQSGVVDRLRWQESFNNNVNRLLIDFDLSLVPECRLNHLDRMHEWFIEHGGKQQRKDKKAPNFLTADRNNMPAGSAANISSKLSGTSLILAGSYAMRSPRTPRAAAAAAAGTPRTPR
mmetsp:Transcript_81663/g.141988  ORF Transcript_81663/g.141988 Transcript_81663/m.141988 type:complete len:243 (-) Transcript_81663:156-884(-)